MIEKKNFKKNMFNLVIAFAVILGILSMSIVFSFYSVNKVSVKTENLIDSHIPHLRDISILQNEVDMILINLHEYYATLDSEYYYANQKKLDKVKKSLSKLNSSKDKTGQLITIIENLISYKKYSDLFHAEMELGRDRNWDTLRDYLAMSQKYAENIMDALNILSNHTRQLVSQESKSTLDNVKTLNYSYLIFSFSALLVFIFVLYNLYCRLKDQSKLYRAAYLDHTTSLPNRRYFEEKLNTIFDQNPNTRLTVLLIRLDRFKLVTGSFGHIVGDQLLNVISAWIVDIMKKQGVIFDVFQFTGVSWIVLLPDTNNKEVASQIADNILKMSNYPMNLEDRELASSCSIGICASPEHGNNVEDLLSNVDSALRLSKKEGGNCFRFYEKQMSDDAKKWVEIENALRFAINNNEFELYYQPKYDAQNEQVNGVEALLRWSNNGESISPSVFIPIAESSGLIVSIGNWVLNRACQQWVEWKKAGLKLVPISVNVSALQFMAPDFINQVMSAITRSGMPPSMLELEITEEATVQDSGRVIEVLNQLKHIGVSLSIDDFGTGYSSLSYLRQFPIDVLKIDRSFVLEINKSEADASVVKLILGLAKELEIKVVAEGVETIDQYQKLKNWQCDLIQGFYFSKPLPAIEYANLLLEDNKVLPMPSPLSIPSSI